MDSTGRSSAQDAREMFELKKKAAQYYEENGVPEKMEKILNSTFYDNPNDVYGHLANFFEGFQRTPTITKVISREALDGKGQTTLQTEIHCMVKNFEKLMCTSLCSNESYPPDSMKPDDKDAAELERQKDIEKSVEFINSNFNQCLRDLDPTEQQNIDTLLLSTLEKLETEEADRIAKESEEKGEEEDIPSARSPAPQESKTKPKSPKGKSKGPAVVIIPDEPREKYFCGCTAISSLSQAMASVAASIKGVPLYKYIATCRYDEVPESMSLPLPMVTIMMSGKVAPGKLNCVKEYMIIPKHDMPYRESMKHIVSIYNHCAKNLSTKTGVVGKAVNDQGALWSTFDRPEQGLDLLQEAITQLELTPGEHFHIALNCAGQEIFDYDKGKYEVMGGQQKTAEDLVDFWTDIVTRYPAIIALIDPMRKQEKESWMRLCESISEKCYVIGDVVHHRPGLLKEEEITTDFKTSGVVLRMEHMNSVTDILATSKKMADADNEIVIGTSVGETTDTFCVDLAVGCGARFIKLGAPCRGERVAKFNHLLQIEATLEESGSLQVPGEHVFALIKPPTPPPEDTEGEVTAGSDQATSRSNDTKKS